MLRELLRVFGLVSRCLGLYKRYFKRPLDIVLALFSLIILSPVMLMVALLVRIKLGSPVIFKQPRPGLYEKSFIMYKFRTMTNERNDNGELLPDEKRLTSFGKFLRSTSLDELPELLNILRGDMSFVGPRPLLVKYLALYDHEQRRRHEVRPGLTGLAQVNGRNGISWEQKFELDTFYVDHVTFLGDLKILLKTFLAVLSRQGISSQTSATMEEFCGTKKSDIRVDLGG